MNSRRKYLIATVTGVVLLMLVAVLAKLVMVNTVWQDEMTGVSAAVTGEEREEPRPAIVTRDGVVLASDTLHGEVRVALDLYLRRFNSTERLESELASVLERVSELTGRPLKQLWGRVEQYEDKIGGEWHEQEPEAAKPRPLLLIDDLESSLIGQLKSSAPYGVFVDSRYRREYPFGEELLGRTLGWSRDGGDSSAGLEKLLSKRYLQDSEQHPELASLRNTERLDSSASREALRLTVDYRLQGITEASLRDALADRSAEWAIAAVMDPDNGELLSVATSPTLDPARPGRTIEKNGWPASPLTEKSYEPGSIMKPLVAAWAHDRGEVSLDRRFFADSGLTVDGFRISEAEQPEGFGELTVGGMIEVSSNVGMAKVGMELGQDNLSQALADYRLFSETGLELPQVNGVAPGDYESANWSRVRQATVGFGQGFEITAPQLLRAWATLANGGRLVEPHITLGDAADYERASLQPGERVLSEETVRRVRQHLVNVVQRGTGTAAKLPNVTVAGKTGTGQVYLPGEGYSERKYLTSFIGFFPAEQPRYMVLVQVMDPSWGSYGGTVAAPVFKQIARQIVYAKGLHRTAHKPETRKQ